MNHSDTFAHHRSLSDYGLHSGYPGSSGLQSFGSMGPLGSLAPSIGAIGSAGALGSTGSMSTAAAPGPGPRVHGPQLSINSLSSLVEPVTPPSGPAERDFAHTPIFPAKDAMFKDPKDFNPAKDFNSSKELYAQLAKVPLPTLRGEIVGLAKDQHGCRFLQKKLDDSCPQAHQNFELIYAETYPHLYELIIDPFGNYLVQKLVRYCGPDALSAMLTQLGPNLFQISINQHGTRALQKIIDSLSPGPQLDVLVRGLRPFIIELIKDLNGNHVIQKILQRFTPAQCQFVYDAILADLITVATHKHGCCVLQKCLNHVTPNQLNEFVGLILSPGNFARLANDQFGNYVLQYLILTNSPAIHVRFYHNLIDGGLAAYCSLKFSSNVIEKFVKSCYANEPTAEAFVSLKFQLVGQILQPDSLNRLVNDPFGNYVVQTIIDHLVNPAVDYLALAPEALASLIPPPVSNDAVKHDIVALYFKNTKVVSSFGKRIQTKVATVLSQPSTPTFYANFEQPHYERPYERSFGLEHSRSNSLQQNYVLDSGLSANFTNLSLQPLNLHNINLNQPFLKTPQVFSNAPVNDPNMNYFK